MSVFAIKDAGVDWITVTSSQREKAELLEDSSFLWLQHEEQAGNKIRPWSMSGYNGFHCGGVSFGELNGAWLLRLSGPTAEAHWKRAFHLSTNCSRIDLQVTVGGVENQAEVIQSHYLESGEFFRNWMRPPSVHLWFANDDTATLYLNKRVSENFGRIYDKAKESKMDHYRNCLRYEVEFKGDMAALVGKSLWSSEPVQPAIVGRVRRFFLERGINPLFAGEPVHTIRVSRTRPDTDRLLTWLQASVSRSVQDLIALGKLPEVLASLGITQELLDEVRRQP